MKNLMVPVLLFLSYFTMAQDISQWRGIDRDGIYNSSGLLTEWPAGGPELLWHFDELGDGHGSAAVANDLVYISGTEGENGFVLALDMKGNEIWKTGYGKEWMESYEGVRTTPAVIGDKLYIMSGYGLVSCINALTGTIHWQVDVLKDYEGINLKWGITENLLIYDDFLIVTPGGEKHNVIALNRFSGKLEWTSKANGEISAYCSPAYFEHNGRKLVVTHTEKSILGLDALNGKLLWSVDQPNRWSVHANTPVYQNGKLYCVSGYGKGGVMLELSSDGNEVKELWRDEELDNKLGGFVVLGNRIYGSGDFNKKWYCLDWESGKVLYESKALRKGNIISAEGLLYWYSQSGDVALVEAGIDSFRVISQFEVPYGKAQHWAHLVIADKKLFVRHGNSLMVYSLEKKKGIIEWRGEKRSGIYPNELGLLDVWPEEGPGLIWYTEEIPTGYASLSVSNGKVFTTGTEDEHDVLIALDNEGKQLWATPYGRKWNASYDGSRSTPTIEENRIYVSSGLGDLACVNKEDGQIIWQVPASEKYGGNYGKWGIAESLLIVDDKVIFTPGGDVTTMIALDKFTGELVWQSPTLNDKPSYTSPTLISRNGEDIISQVTEYYFIGVNPENGEIFWKFSFGDYATGSWKANNQTNSPLYHDGEFFLTSGYDHKSVLVRMAEDNRSVSLVWEDTLLDVHHGGVLMIDGYIYGANWEGNRDGKWTCLRWEDGKKMYSEEWINKGSIIAADDKLFCYAEKKGMVGMLPVDPEKFELTSSFKVPYGKGPHWAHPVIDQGILYIRHGNAIMAYQIK